MKLRNRRCLSAPEMETNALTKSTKSRSRSVTVDGSGKGALWRICMKASVFEKMELNTKTKHYSALREK